MIVGTNLYPRISDLPKEEQEPFAKFLEGQTCPYVDLFPEDMQDFYYKHDYERWKDSLKGKPVVWD